MDILPQCLILRVAEHLSDALFQKAINPPSSIIITASPAEAVIIEYFFAFLNFRLYLLAHKDFGPEFLTESLSCAVRSNHPAFQLLV